MRSKVHSTRCIIRPIGEKVRCQRQLRRIPLELQQLHQRDQPP